MRRGQGERQEGKEDKNERKRDTRRRTGTEVGGVEREKRVSNARAVCNQI